jgi:tRNA threonylcarbamoyladenosine biosynthesis protein TsaB
MILYIDTTEYEKVTYALVREKVIKKIFKTDSHKSNEILQYLEKFLKQTKAVPESIKKIVVNSGPGSFTSVRVGLSHAQALGLGWNIPVVPIPKDKVPKDLTKLL